MGTVKEIRREARPDHAKDMLVRNTTDVLRAFMECSNEIQRGVLQMTQIINDPNTDKDEKAAAADTLVEALYPQYVRDGLGIDSLDYELRERGLNEKEERSLDKEEAIFSEKLAQVMEKKQMTQAQLAAAIHVGQPAISMMLSRNCRPQQGTIRKLAKALGVQVKDLWPGNGEK